jgi:hypothetical protein
MNIQEIFELVNKLNLEVKNQMNRIEDDPFEDDNKSINPFRLYTDDGDICISFLNETIWISRFNTCFPKKIEEHLRLQASQIIKKYKYIRFHPYGKFTKRQILHNGRPEPDVFENTYDCDFCTNFTSQVIAFGIYLVCKSCLQSYINDLDKHMVDNFQSDFEKSREESEKC